MKINVPQHSSTLISNYYIKDTFLPSIYYTKHFSIFRRPQRDKNPLDEASSSSSTSELNTHEQASHEFKKRTPTLHLVPPQPVRVEFTKKERLCTMDLQNMDIGIGMHHKPEDMSDKIALFSVKFLRVFADAFFRQRYIHRAIVLETVAAVPGMVAGMIRHLHSLRKMKHDGGWIHQLLTEAENERMHLMTWMKVTQPSLIERLLITLVQGVFFNGFFLFYLTSSRTAHRFVAYLEEEAVISYTGFLNEILSGKIKNDKAPQIAIDYWHLKEDATLLDVVLAVRADEANHRDVNHYFSDRILLKKENLRKVNNEEEPSHDNNHGAQNSSNMNNPLT